MPIRIHRNGRSVTVADAEADAYPAWELYARADVAAHRATEPGTVQLLLNSHDETLAGYRAEIDRLTQRAEQAEATVAEIQRLAEAINTGQFGDPIDADDMFDQLYDIVVGGRSVRIPEAGES